MSDKPAVIDDFQNRYGSSVVGALGVKLLDVEDDRYTAHMDVSELALNSQHFLNGGISPLVAETLASFASLQKVKHISGAKVAGLSVSSTHLVPGQSGDNLTFVATEIRLGGKLHVWSVEMRKKDVLLSVSQVTVYIKLPQNPNSTSASPV